MVTPNKGPKAPEEMDSQDLWNELVTLASAGDSNALGFFAKLQTQMGQLIFSPGASILEIAAIISMQANSGNPQISSFVEGQKPIMVNYLQEVRKLEAVNIEMVATEIVRRARQGNPEALEFLRNRAIELRAVAIRAMAAEHHESGSFAGFPANIDEEIGSLDSADGEPREFTQRLRAATATDLLPGLQFVLKLVKIGEKNDGRVVLNREDETMLSTIQIPVAGTETALTADQTPEGESRLTTLEHPNGQESTLEVWPQGIYQLSMN